MTLAATEHQGMKGQVEVTWRMLRTITHSLMVHTRVLEAYIHLVLMYTTDHIFPVIPIKDMINEDGDPTIPHKLEIGTKPTASHLCLLLCPYVVRKATANVETKALNMRHQAQKSSAVYSLEFHSIKNDILCMYPVQGREYLHMMLCLMKVSLVR